MHDAFLPDTDDYVTSEAQEGSPHVRIDGTDFWLLGNDDKPRHFALCPDEDGEAPARA